MTVQPVDFLVILMSAPREHEPGIEVGTELRKQGMTAAFVTPLRRSAAAIRDTGFSAISVQELIASRRWQVPSPAEQRLLEERYGFISLRDLCFPEARVLGTSEERLFPRAVGYLYALEETFDRFQPRNVVQNVGAELLRRSAYAVARRRKTRHLVLRPTPFPGRITFSIDSEAGDWSLLDMNTLPSVPLEKALALMSRFREEKIGIAATNQPRLSGQKIRTFLELFRMRSGDDHDALGSWDPIRKTKRYLKALVNARLMSGSHVEPQPEEPYFFYPIHVWHDSAITVRAPHFIRQHHVVEMLSDTIPQGYRLYVKEHPVSIGRNPLGAMLRLRRLRNVSLVDPWVSAHRLVENARAVVVINSTVGFEALAYGKAVVVLGAPFYCGRDLTIDVGNLFDLRAALAKAVRWTPRRESVASFFYLAHEATFPGSQITPGGRSRDVALNLADFARKNE